MSTGKDIILCGTHIPALVRAFELSEGDVLELGTGYFSTNLLRWLCEMSGRTLYSYETGWSWYKIATRKPVPFQKVFKIDNFDEADIDRHWGLVLIDHAPTRRRIVDIKRLANLADYIVIHDTNPEHDGVANDPKKKGYQYSQIWSLFKYKYDFTKYSPHTRVVSNFHSLEKFA